MAPFSKATISRCRGRALLLSRYCLTLPLIRTLYCRVLSKEVSSTILKSFVWRDLGLNPGLPDHWRTLNPLGQWAGYYIYIYIWVCVCVCVCFGNISSLIHIWLNIIDIFCRHIFVLPYWSYDIRWELVDKPFHYKLCQTLCPTLDYHQGRVYYKSDVTFVWTLLLCKKKSVCTVAASSVYFFESVL